MKNDIKIKGLNLFKLSSINNRIIFTSIIVVSAFIVITGVTLDKTFYRSAYSALEERLTGQIYLIMADREVIASSIDNQYAQIRLPHNGVSSHLSAFITLSDGKVLWQSRDASEAAIPPLNIFNSGTIEHGKKTFQQFKKNNTRYIALSIAIYWDQNKSEQPLIYHISDDLTDLNNTISDYQYKLWSNLIIMSLMLFIALFITLRWGLKPLRDVEQEIKAVEQGKQEQLVQTYPDEITPLTRNINQLIQFERQQQLRYKNALADLSHSLKTPLAIIQGQEAQGQKLNDNFSAENREAYQSTINNAVERMNSIIEYQLQRASSASPTSHIKNLLLAPVMNSLIDSMKKIYHEKNITFNISLDNDIYLKMDEGDFMEVMGNLLDNACKWCHKSIDISFNSQKKHWLSKSPMMAPA
ncbi:histidine kinase dimerization/phospho-acceptor domain-containing protein [sulfur-oxidizing endosymbiont of Gigantopelta aegis]|uniref:histidine kinase dimerization/phospho-acceptor domain-containing protein n=1 Tax=sulfur-oxidizing endosymbiont of Gigantopelta aegis TaxID=2794934 RepID=UPI0018DD3285|nr:histidine kinase dimerization/phospho-acceptor domain-containing protein [sulfur-oxidizing endosymbiont of Gigantopelta aegis]